MIISRLFLRPHGYVGKKRLRLPFRFEAGFIKVVDERHYVQVVKSSHSTSATAEASVGGICGKGFGDSALPESM